MRIEERNDIYTAYDSDNQEILSVRGYCTIMPINKYEGEEELFTIAAIDFYDKDVEQEKAALKEIFCYIRDQFDRYPGID